MFGLQDSNPVNSQLAYHGNARHYGKANDPMVVGRIGGVNVFSDALDLYNSNGDIVGGLGLSGDTSCADHNIAWRTRNELDLDYVPAGVSASGDDIIFDVTANPNGGAGISAGGFGHASCGSDSMTGNSFAPVATNNP